MQMHLQLATQNQRSRAQARYLHSRVPRSRHSVQRTRRVRLLAPETTMASKQMLVVVAAALAVVFLPALAAATEHWVGDDQGWTLGFDYSAWAESKQFKVGDTLVFKYTNPSHTVVEVNGVDFASCNKPGDATKLTTGEDHVTLDKEGRRWFVCGVGEHCQNGMKLKINVLAADEGTPALAPGSPSMTPPPPASSPAAKVQTRLALAVVSVTVVIAAVLVF